MDIHDPDDSNMEVVTSIGHHSFTVAGTHLHRFPLVSIGIRKRTLD